MARVFPTRRDSCTFSQCITLMLFQPSQFIMQLTAVKEQSIAFTTISFRNFACLDADTNKFYLNLDTLSEYRNDRLNFIGTVGCNIDSESSNLIDISQNPITIINGISYFLLAAKTCQLEILKLLYMLCQSLYINNEQIIQLQQTIDKAIEKDDGWDFCNFLYLVNSSFSDFNLSETKEGTSCMRSSKQSKNDRHSFMMNYLHTFFSSVQYVQNKKLQLLDLEEIRHNIQEQYNPFITRAYLYDSILEACSTLLPGNRPLLVSKFEMMNCQKLCEQFEMETLNNLEILSLGSALKGRKQYLKVKEQILEPFREWEMTWLSGCSIFRQKIEKIEILIQKQYRRALLVEKKKRQMKQIQILEQIFMKDPKENISITLGNQKLNEKRLSYSTYLTFLNDKIYSLIETISSNEWRSKNKPITTNTDLLVNLRTRIEINERKKASLEEGIKLVEKERDYLHQLEIAFKLKSEYYEVIDS